jgi:ADP-ribose pyrophosphatase YjhB (NUDIX family)
MRKAEHEAGHIGESRQGQEPTVGSAGMEAELTGYRRGLPERVLRRMLAFWFLLSRAHTIGVRGAAFDTSGRVFLVRHTYVAGWHMPGGGVEIGENCHSSLVREFAEEGNLRLGDPAMLFGIYHNNHNNRRDHVAFYVCHNVVQAENHKGDREIAESGFFATDALPDGTTPATRRRLAEIAGAAPQSLEW